ncbi:uncharacterized protein PG998_010661 [Apiospora kogelbergensis]|uniref:uncharacterized protein n=1 Tax=Apiospora kogelbergensis TaxID=1337665 RepID=UPI00312F0B64
MPPNAVVGAIPPPPGVTPNLEKPEDVIATVNMATQISSICLMTPFIALRLYTKAWVAPPFLLDDFFETFKVTRVISWVLIILLGLFYIAGFFVKAQVRHPVDSYWNLKKPGTDVVSQRAVFVADTVMSTISDLAVLTLPIPAVISLKLSLWKKLKIWNNGPLATWKSHAAR